MGEVEQVGVYANAGGIRIDLALCASGTRVSAKARPDWARSQDRSALTLSLPDQGGLTEEDGDEGGKDGVGQEGPRGDTRGE